MGVVSAQRGAQSGEKRSCKIAVDDIGSLLMSFDPSADNFAHMTEYDPEDPANAEQDYEDYLAGRKPMEALLERLGVSTPTLRTAVRLNWSGMKIFDRDCDILAALFKKNTAYTAKPPLANLGLDRNSIGDAGLVAISESLKISNSMLKNLTHLWLNDNRIGDVRAHATNEATYAPESVARSLTPPCHPPLRRLGCPRLQRCWRQARCCS